MKMVNLEPIRRTTLTVFEIATYLGVSTDKIYQMVRERAIPHFRIGTRVLFKRKAIDEWIDMQMIRGMEDDY